MLQVQEYVNQKYPTKEDREKVIELDISGWNEKEWKEKPDWKKLGGDLNLTEFPNLEKLNCSFNEITSLNLTNCSKLTELKCWDNQLKKINFTTLPYLKILYAWTNYLTKLNWKALSPENLTNISISNNNFTKQEISCFSEFINLEELYLGNDVGERLVEKTYNHFYGHVKELRNLTKLKKLQIEGTDINLLEELKNVEIVSWGIKAIIRQLNLIKEEAEKLRWTNQDKLAETLNEILINHAKKQLGLNLTSEQEGKIEQLGNDIACNVHPKNIELESKIQNLQKHWERLLKEQKVDRQNNITSTIIPLERLFVIRSNIKQFLKKWGKEYERKWYEQFFSKTREDELTELSQLQNPNEINAYWYVGESGQWIARGTAVTGGILAATVNPVLGGILAASSPVVEVGASQMKERIYEAKEKKWNGFLTDADEFLDNYNELMGILKQVEVREFGAVNVVLKNLKDKVHSFLETYDEDGNEEIDIYELINNRVKFSKELNKLQEIAETIKKLEDKVVDYRQGKLVGDEEKVEERKAVVISNKLSEEIIEQPAKPTDLKLIQMIKRKILVKGIEIKEIINLGKQEQFLVVSKIEPNLLATFNFWNTILGKEKFDFAKPYHLRWVEYEKESGKVKIIKEKIANKWFSSEKEVAEEVERVQVRQTLDELKIKDKTERIAKTEKEVKKIIFPEKELINETIDKSEKRKQEIYGASSSSKKLETKYEYQQLQSHQEISPKKN